jgi:hypothetical protein
VVDICKSILTTLDFVDSSKSEPHRLLIRSDSLERNMHDMGGAAFGDFYVESRLDEVLPVLPEENEGMPEQEHPGAPTPLTLVGAMLYKAVLIQGCCQAVQRRTTVEKLHGSQARNVCVLNQAGTLTQFQALGGSLLEATENQTQLLPQHSVSKSTLSMMK